ncbi:MAG TPA: ABC-type transport auxiliary lipoprotein family protein, partial [Thauera aminoaromatica]|nr:ABC-type transport auxiliary lipoprotein family protein [Thauera aminoaromatica]
LAPARVAVSSPPWLQTTTMHYRDARVDPGRRRAYADNRWAAPPPAMLGLVLERTLGAGEGGGCRLQVQLDEFEQVFTAGERSEARLLARFALLPVRGAAVIASASLVVAEPATTADASGGASAFRAATERLALAIAQWIAETDRALSGGLGIAGRCQR